MPDLERLHSQARKGVQLLKERPKSWQRVVANQAAAMLRSTHVPALPAFLSIEPTNVCNYRCPVCETGAGILGRASGHMKLRDFQTIIDQVHHHTRSILFYFMGEPFLNPAAYDMIRYAKDRNIHMTTCTNGEIIDAEKLIASGLDEISFQIGGTTQETHEVYRVRGVLDKVLATLEACVEEKRRRNSPISIDLGLIVMRHNEHQVSDFFKLAHQLGIDNARVIAPCVRTIDQAHQFLTEEDRYWTYDRQLFEEQGILKTKEHNRNKCWWIWHSLNIQVNGDVIPCCRDPKGEFVMGNVLRQPLEEIWNGQAYRSFRHRILTAQEGINICDLCSGYDEPGLYDFREENLADIIAAQRAS
jgi:radical SAM protein with 4Fe4S-binding SPASM domain